MFIIRPIEEKDFEALITIAFTAHAGLLSLPKNHELLQKKIATSLASISKNIEAPDHETYLFVLENTTTGEIGGTCGIYSRTGVRYPHYSYAIREECHQLTTDLVNFEKKIKILTPVEHAPGPSEMCSLYLLPNFRKGGLGKLLSLSRYLFVASEPQRFTPLIVASLRGVIDKNGKSSFWESIGSHFTNSTFEEISMLIQNDPAFVKYLLPKSSIYIPLLSKQTQRMIGKPHTNSAPALKMLYEEGFSFYNEIDILDGGPTVFADVSQVRTIKNSRIAKVAKAASFNNDRMNMMIATVDTNFRCCLGQVRIFKKNQIGVNEQTLKLLNIDIGDRVRYVALK